MQRPRLDKKDLRLLAELDMHARQPFSSIAKRIGISREATHNRVKRLEEEGVITGYFAAVDTSSLGYIYTRYHLWLYDTADEHKIIAHVRRQPNVAWLLSTDGDEDMIITIIARDFGEIKRTCDEIYFRFSSRIKKKQVYMVARMLHYPHSYLYPEPFQREETLGRDTRAPLTDNTSRRMLSLLSADARQPATEIAKQVGLSPKAVRDRIRQLRRNKSILCFRTKLNIQKLGYQHFKVFLYMNDVSRRVYDRMMRALCTDPQVIYVTESIGDADLEFDIALPFGQNIYPYMNDMRATFREALQGYRFAFVDSQVVIHYLPY